MRIIQMTPFLDGSAVGQESDGTRGTAGILIE